ncbi:MAG: 50S ribosomal protein L32 [Planctomycetota bacterium]|nr:MAG: 50S ribosomal protein L32 [Planctomycetota bacterium]
MAVPQRRQTRSRGHMRRSHHALSAKALVSCTKCSNKILPHTVCPTCGNYKGRDAIKVKGY